TGEVDERIGVDQGSFSLGLSIDDQNRIIAAIRGQPLLRVFQNGKLVSDLSPAFSEELSAIWSEVLFENGRLHIVDYLTSTLKTFRYPIGSSTDSNDA
ncbi:unnamed protein product, partial [Gongylonema pulchrum]|uniref:LAM_G_DOMAIN domain-containing protein n=1 Tax=Gongylonema pulchrum TaxID=637853 RepID=A0A183ET34_9BILA